jgi:hypothetical protein
VAAIAFERDVLAGQAGGDDGLEFFAQSWIVNDGSAADFVANAQQVHGMALTDGGHAVPTMPG